MSDFESGSWNPDPTGRFELRWFDGSQWTSSVSTGGTSQVDEQWTADEAATMAPPLGFAPPPGAPTTPPGTPVPDMPPTDRAGIGARFAARLIDGLLLGVVAIALFVVLLLVIPTEFNECTTDAGLPALCEEPTDAGIMIILLGYLVFAAVVVIGYYGVLQGQKGATLGQRMLSIKVVDIETSMPIGTGRGVVRYLVSIASSAVLLLGFLWALWDPERQTWHDKAARSVVVPAR